MPVISALRSLRQEDPEVSLDASENLETIYKEKKAASQLCPEFTCQVAVTTEENNAKLFITFDLQFCSISQPCQTPCSDSNECLTLFRQEPVECHLSKVSGN